MQAPSNVDDKPKGAFPGHPFVGINAQRSCTDCFCIFVLIAFWGVMGFVAYLGFEHGDPDRIVRGTDYLGNVCGRGSPEVTVDNWRSRQWLWYPISFDARERRLLIREAFSLGICVEECPSMDDVMVRGYGSINATADPPVWPVMYNSRPQFFRCFPEFLTFNCSGASDCLQALNTSASSFVAGSKTAEMVTQGFRELQAGWWVILASNGIAIVVCFIWLFMLRRLVKPMVVITALLVLVLLVGGGVICWLEKGSAEAEDPPQTESAKYWMAGAITLWVVAFIYLCVMIFLWRDLMTACDIIEEASKVPVKIPTMALIPPFFLVMLIPMLLFCLFVAFYVQSAGDTIQVTLPVPVFNASEIQNRSADVVSGNSTIMDNFEAREYTLENWRIYAHFYNLFMFLWTFGILNAIDFMSLSLCGVFWYFSAPGDAKDPPLLAVPRAVKMVVRYHIGTVALGAFFVAVIQLVRFILVFIEQKMKEVGERTDAAKFLFKCLHCVLACLERVVKYINKNAYIVTAITGESFIPAARRALNLLAANALSVGAVTVVSEYVMMFGKVMITAACVVIAWALLEHADLTGGITSGVLILCLVAVITFLIATLFINIFSVSIDTILLCYCYDRAEPGLNYFPEDLHKRVLEQQLRSGKGSDTGKGTGGADGGGGGGLLSEQMQPLNPAIAAPSGRARFDDL